MNNDQWNQKKLEAPADSAERLHPAPGSPAGRGVAAPGNEVAAVLEHAGAGDRAGDLSWNPWQP